MDWPNERYVRLYVRDTTTWKRLRFEGQSTFALLLRKFDRAGILEIGDMEPWEVAVVHAEVPEQVARAGMEALLRLGVYEVANGALICTNFLEAQEASMSPAMRQKEHRLRRRDEVRSGLDASQRETAVYFVQSEHGGEIKIGRADDVARRLAGLQTGRPDKLVLLAAAQGTLQQERELHERFAAFRVKGEWFSPAPEIMELVRDVAARGPEAFTAPRDTSHYVTANAAPTEQTRHETSAVTPYRAVPSHADPSQAVHTDAREPVRVRDVPPSAAQIQTRFKALFEARFNAAPYMGGGDAVRTFAERLIDTARRRGVDPLVLLAEAFARWQPKPDDEIAQNAPYASFAGRFGSLLESQSGHGVGEQEQLQTAQIEAMQRKDMVRYRELVAEERRRFPNPNGGANANPAR